MRAILTFFDQAEYEACLVVEAARQPRACVASWLMLGIGLAYLVGPINLIPDKTPYVGHLDEAAFLIGGITLARYSLPAALRRRARERTSRQPGGGHLRRHVLRCGAMLFGSPILRLCLGRGPDAHEKRLFSSGFIAGEAIVPPILRGLHAVPAAKEPLGNLAVLNLVREGVVRKPLDIGFVRMPMPSQPGNPLSYWHGIPFSFLHFEKAAGTSLANLITGLLHPIQIDDDPERATAPHVLSAFPPHLAEEISRKKFVWGHYDLPALRRLDPARTIITTLRRPRDRVLSLYRFWRSIDPHLVEGGFVGFNVRAAHEMDLLAFLRADDPLIRNYIDNVYVRRLTGAYVLPENEDPLQRSPSHYLELALRELQAISFVGIVEQLDRSLPELQAVIGAEHPLHLPRLNTSDAHRSGRTRGTRTVDRPVVSPAVETELQRLTWLDDGVYEAAVRRSHADREAHQPDWLHLSRGAPDR